MSSTPRAHLLLCALLLVTLLALSACGAAPVGEIAPSLPEATASVEGASAPAGERASSSTPRGALSLAESWPLETRLDHADIPDAAEVWVQMIEAAERSVDLGHFYANSEPGRALEPVIAAIEAAAARGVEVRLIVDTKLLKGNREVPDRLEALEGIEVRRYKVGKLMGGVQHAKYMVIDGREAFLGSQNLDWRSLEHVQELGARVDAPPVVAALAALFELDWALAGGADPVETLEASRVGAAWPVPTRYGEGAGAIDVEVLASPRGWLPAGIAWDLPRLIEVIDQAAASVRVQIMTYSTVNYSRSRFLELDRALRRAARRGVAVQLMVSDWNTRKKSLPSIQALQRLPNVSVRIVTIPQWSGGFVPFARTIHAKFMVVDGARAWLGTSNWSGDYFFASRNVGLLVDGAPLAQDLTRLFDDLWGSEYAADLDPEAKYEPPKIR
jgi:phosphatidylserine/phosphatidylglycerophosphate/cardiolipin synthase-like enzyme